MSLNSEGEPPPRCQLGRGMEQVQVGRGEALEELDLD